VTGYIKFKYVYGIALNYYHKIEKCESIHDHAAAILHPGRQFLHSCSKRLCLPTYDVDRLRKEQSSLRMYIVWV